MNNYLIRNNEYLNVTNSEFLLEMLRKINPLAEIDIFKYKAIAKTAYLNNHITFNKNEINSVDYCPLTNYYSSVLFSKTVEDIKRDTGTIFTEKQSICLLHHHDGKNLNLIAFFVYNNLPYFINMQKYGSFGDLNKTICHFVDNVKYKTEILGLKKIKRQDFFISSIYSDFFKLKKLRNIKLNNVNSVSYVSHLSYYVESDNDYKPYFKIEDYTNQIESEMTYNKIKVDCFSTSHSVKFEPTPKLEGYNLDNPIYVSNIKNLNKTILETDHAVFFTDASLKKQHNGGGIVILTKESSPIYTSLVYKEKHLKNAKTPDELECLTILYALKYAVSNNIANVKIYTDSQNFLSAFYQTNKKLYKDLSRFINKIYYCAFKINIEFIKVKAHTVDIHYNNVADSLAKRNY